MWTIMSTVAFKKCVSGPFMSARCHLHVVFTALTNPSISEGSWSQRSGTTEIKPGFICVWPRLAYAYIYFLFSSISLKVSETGDLDSEWSFMSPQRHKILWRNRGMGRQHTWSNDLWWVAALNKQVNLPRTQWKQTCIGDLIRCGNLKLIFSWKKLICPIGFQIYSNLSRNPLLASDSDSVTVGLCQLCWPF